METNSMYRDMYRKHAFHYKIKDYIVLVTKTPSERENKLLLFQSLLFLYKI